MKFRKKDSSLVFIDVTHVVAMYTGSQQSSSEVDITLELDTGNLVSVWMSIEDFNFIQQYIGLHESVKAAGMEADCHELMSMQNAQRQQMQQGSQQAQQHQTQPQAYDDAQTMSEATSKQYNVIVKANNMQNDAKYRKWMQDNAQELGKLAEQLKALGLQIVIDLDDNKLINA